MVIRSIHVIFVCLVSFGTCLSLGLSSRNALDGDAIRARTSEFGLFVRTLESLVASLVNGSETEALVTLSPSPSQSLSPSHFPSQQPSLSPSVSPSLASSLPPSSSPSISHSLSASPTISPWLLPSPSSSVSSSPSAAVSPSLSTSPSHIYLIPSPSASGNTTPSPVPSLSPSPMVTVPQKHRRPTDFPEESDEEIWFSPEPVAQNEFADSNQNPMLPFETAVVAPKFVEPDSSVILLHGLGGNADSVLPFIEQLRSKWPNRARFVIPQAKNRFVDILNDTVPSWFNVLSTEIDGPQAEDEVIQAAEDISKIAKYEEEVHGIDRSRIVIAGISQGGAVALTTYLRHRYAGALVISGYLPIADTYPRDLTNDSDGAPLLMIHGAEDRTVPLVAAELSVATIRGLGREVAYIKLDGEGHRLEGAISQVIYASIGLLNFALA